MDDNSKNFEDMDFNKKNWPEFKVQFELRNNS